MLVREGNPASSRLRGPPAHTPAFHRSRLVRASYKHTKFRLGRCALFIESCDSVLLTFQKVYLHKDVCFTKEEIRKVQFALSYICPTFHLWHGSTHYTWLGNFSATENGRINLDYPIRPNSDGRACEVIFVSLHYLFRLGLWMN